MVTFVRKQLGQHIGPEDINELQREIEEMPDGGGLASVSADPSPTLGGDLDLDGHAIPGVTDVLAPGDPGDVLTTNAAGTSITAIKPGRIDARVRGLSTAASDNTTLLNALAIEAAANGQELWLPDGTYDGMMEMVSHLRVGGTGTLRIPDSWHPQVLYIDDADVIEDVVIHGVTLDGRGENKVIVDFKAGTAGFGSASHHVTFDNVTFQNSQTYAIGGKNATDVTVERCRFRDVECATYVWNAGNWRVLYCDIEDTEFNAFFFPIDVDVSLGNLQVIGNRGTDIGRMMVEVWDYSTHTGYFDGPVIRDNFLVQKADITATDNYGYSVVAAHNAHVIDNVAVCLDTTDIGLYGYEITSTDAVVRGNRAYGFVTGFIANISSNATLTENLAEQCYNGFEWANANAALSAVIAERNTARNCRDTGFYVRRQGSGNPGAHIIAHNRIIRDASWSGDSGRTFFGIKSEGMDGPLDIIRNIIEQGMASPTLSAFQGMELHSEDDTNHFVLSRVDDNIFIDRKTGGGGMVPLVSPGDAAETNITPTGNRLWLPGSVPTASNTWS